MGLIANGHSGDLVLNLGSRYVKFGKRNREQFQKMQTKEILPYHYPKTEMKWGALLIDSLNLSAQPLSTKNTFGYSSLLAYMDPLMKTHFDGNRAWIEKMATMPQELVSLINDNFTRLYSEELLLPRGYCHGDFTLENLFIDKGGGFWAIDPIKGYIESPIMDVVKIRQDVIYGWDAHRQYGLPKSWLDLHLDLCRFYLPKVLVKLDVMNIARIYPYGNKKTKYWCIKALGQAAREWKKLS